MINLSSNIPYLIAEIGGNHEGDFSKAKKLCSLAVSTNVDSVKFQLYTGDTLVNKLISPDRNAHFKNFELSINQHIYLAEMCLEAGKNYSASVWDMDMFTKIDKFLSYYKIGSGDLTNRWFIKKILSSNKPIIISTGLSTFYEIERCIEFIRNENSLYNQHGMIIVLQCTSMYPILNNEANLNVLSTLKNIENIVVGYSDHTVGMEALVTSYVMGAKLLEFHFTDSREGKQFRDHAVSLCPNEIDVLTDKLNLISDLLGSFEKLPLQTEIETGHVESFRRGVYLRSNLKAGKIISEDDLVVLRPNKGISAVEFYNIIGKKLLIDLNKLEPLDWKYFE